MTILTIRLQFDFVFRAKTNSIEMENFSLKFNWEKKSQTERDLLDERLYAKKCSGRQVFELVKYT